MNGVLLLVGIFASFVATFIIKRHLLFRHYIKGSHIPFLEPKSYVEGSFRALNTHKESIAERVEKYFRIKGDFFGAFMGEMPYIFTKDLDLLYKIWVKDSHKHIDRPFVGALTGHNDVSLLQANGDVWRKTRRAIGSTMTHSKLKLANVDRDIDYCLNKLMASLERRSTQIGTSADEVQAQETRKKPVIVECSSMFKKYIMDTFLNVAFDRPDQIDYDTDRNEIITNAASVMKKGFSPAVILTLHIPQLAPLLRVVIRVFKLNYFVQYLYDIVDGIIVKTEDNPKIGIERSERRMIHSLLDLYKDNRLTKDELQSNTFFMLMAGWDTTSDSLTALMWQLAMHIDVQEKLRNEIVKDGIESEYLAWVIKESLRLIPPVSTARTINEDFHWKGYTIMKGMILVMKTYSLMRDKRIWGDDANQFKPERFDLNDNKNLQQHPYQYVAFGLGPRNCVGYHLAMIEMKMTISKILMNYTIRATAETPKTLRLKEGSGTVFFINILRDKMPLEFVPLAS